MKKIQLLPRIIRFTNKNIYFKSRYRAPKEFQKKIDTFRHSPQSFKIPQTKDFSVENYNFEQFGDYTKTIESLLSEKEKTQISIKKEKKIKKNISSKEEFDISKYSAWRNLERILPKNNEHGLPVVCKITASPRKFIQVFGKGIEPFRNGKSSTAEYDFEDNNFDQFIVYDYRNTTDYWGPNLPDEEYEKQKEKIQFKRLIKKKWPTKEEFWKSDEPAVFRVNCSRNADFKKFKKWFRMQLENYNESESYDEKISKKLGNLETFDNYTMNYNLNKEMAVFKYSREFFLEENEKLPKNIKFEEPLEIPKKLSDEFLIKN